MAPVLEARGVHKAFGGLRALDDVTVAFAAGQVTSVIGPNGAGKTTLFNVLSGFLPPDAGHVLFGGCDITGWSADRVARAGLVRSFQNLRVLTRMTVLENLLLAAPCQAGERLLANFVARGRVRAQEAASRDRALTALEFIGLVDEADTLAYRLSYGQQKLLVIARLLAVNPAVMMLDEPTAGLDPAMIARMAETIRSVSALGKTIVLIEHNLDVVRGVSDHVVLMTEGRVLRAGRPEAVLADRELLAAYLGIQP